MLFSYKLHTSYQSTTHKGTFNVPRTDDLDLQSRSKVKVKIFQKLVKVPNNWPYLRCFFTLQTSYLLPTYNAIRGSRWHKCWWPLPKVKVKVKFINNEEILNNFLYLGLFCLQTSYLVSTYNPLRRIQWPKYQWHRRKVKVKGQGQISPKMDKKRINWPYLRCYFSHRLHTWYQGITR